MGIWDNIGILETVAIFPPIDMAFAKLDWSNCVTTCSFPVIIIAHILKICTCGFYVFSKWRFGTLCLIGSNNHIDYPKFHISMYGSPELLAWAKHKTQNLFALFKMDMKYELSKSHANISYIWVHELHNKICGEPQFIILLCQRDMWRTTICNNTSRIVHLIVGTSDSQHC